MSSTWQPALASLDDFLAFPCESLAKLQSVNAVDVEAIMGQLAKAVDAAQELRSLVSSELPDASWQSREELDALLAQIQRNLEARRSEARRLEQLRSRLLALATELERGRIAHRRALRVDQLNQLRKQAINEIRFQAGSGGEPKTLPGPAAEQWIEWACGLQEPEDAESLQTLRNGFAQLDDFVTDLEPGMWVANAGPEAPLPNGEELQDLIQDIREQLRSRLLALAAELERGSIVHHRALRVNQLKQLRELAINELRSQGESEEAPPTLPGPEAGQWIEWACGLKEPEDAESLQTLREGFSHLDDFIASLEPDMWRAGESPSLPVLPETAKSTANTHQKPSRKETNRRQEPPVSPGPVPINLKSPEGGNEPPVPPSPDEPSHPSLQSDTPAPDYGTPPWTEESVQRMPAHMRALLASVMGRVNDLVRSFSHRGKPPFTADAVRETSAPPSIISDIETGAASKWVRKWRMPLAVGAVLVLAALGALQWRSHQNHASPGKAIASQNPDLTRSNEDNKTSDASGRSTASETRISNPTLQTEKQSTPLSTTPPAKQVSKADDGASRTPVMTIPNDIANSKKDRASRNGSSEAPDAVPPALPGGFPNGATNMVREFTVAQPKPATPPVRVSSGGVQGLVIHQVAPLYPAQARRDRIQGTVIVQAVIGKDGTVQNVHVLKGNAMLIQAAVDAVKQWRFKPYSLNGEPVEAQTEINVNFTLERQ
jgi:TonB family protein